MTSHLFLLSSAVLKIVEDDLNLKNEQLGVLYSNLKLNPLWNDLQQVAVFFLFSNFGEFSVFILGISDKAKALLLLFFAFKGGTKSVFSFLFLIKRL
jgi:hypothetical protein